MHHRCSSRVQQPTWRNPASRTSIGISAVSAGNRGNIASASSSTRAQLTARPRSDGMAASAMNPRPVRLGHSRPQMYSIVRERLSASNPSSVAMVPCAINMRNRGMPAICRMASSSHRLPSHPRKARFGISVNDLNPAGVKAGVCQNRLTLTRPSRPARARSPLSVNGPSSSRLVGLRGETHQVVLSTRRRTAHGRQGNW